MLSQQPNIFFLNWPEAIWNKFLMSKQLVLERFKFDGKHLGNYIFSFSLSLHVSHFPNHLLLLSQPPLAISYSRVICGLSTPLQTHHWDLNGATPEVLMFIFWEEKKEGKIFPSPLFNLEEKSMFRDEISLETDKGWWKFPFHLNKKEKWQKSW